MYVMAVSFMNNIDAYNYDVLRGRRHGERYICKEDGTSLRIMTLFERVRCFFSSSYRTGVRTDVRRAIDSVTLAMQMTAEHVDEVKAVLFEKMATMNREVYSRKFTKETIHLLKGDQPVNQDTGMFQKIFSLAGFWFKMGNVTMPEGSGGVRGSSGSYVILNGSGKALGIFKPADEEVHAPSLTYGYRWIKRKWFEIFSYFYGSFPAIAGGSGYVCEEIAYRLGKYVQLAFDARENLVPKTRAVTLGEKRGSFQVWIRPQKGGFLQNAMGYLNVDKIHRGSPDERSIDQSEFEMLVINDILLGNIDRHSKNWLLEKRPGEEGVHIRLIDGASSMSPTHSNAYFERRYQYSWTNLPNARHPFSERAKEAIWQLYENTQQLVAMVRERYENERETQHLEGRLARFRSRINVLQKMANEARPMSFFAQLRTTLQVERFLLPSSLFLRSVLEGL